MDGVEVLPHLAYSADVDPSDYDNFRSMRYLVKSRRLESFDEVEEAVKHYPRENSLTKTAVDHGFMKLPRSSGRTPQHSYKTAVDRALCQRGSHKPRLGVIKTRWTSSRSTEYFKTAS